MFGKKKKKDEMPMQKIDLGVYEVAYTDEVIELRAKMSTLDKSAPEGEERYKWVKGKYSWKECLRAGSVLYVRIGLYLTDYLKAVGEEAIQKEKEKLAIVCAVRFQTFNLTLSDSMFFDIVANYMNGASMSPKEFSTYLSFYFVAKENKYDDLIDFLAYYAADKKTEDNRFSNVIKEHMVKFPLDVAISEYTLPEDVSDEETELMKQAYEREHSAEKQ